jgi:hypothetical protein
MRKVTVVEGAADGNATVRRGAQAMPAFSSLASMPRSGAPTQGFQTWASHDLERRRRAADALIANAITRGASPGADRGTIRHAAAVLPEQPHAAFLGAGPDGGA